MVKYYPLFSRKAFATSWKRRYYTRKERKMEAYAVLETGGKQLLVRAGDTIEIEKLSVEEGAEVVLDTVCAVSDGTTLKVGTPYVEGAKVTLAIVAPNKKGPKVINFKMKRRKGSRRLFGHRQQYTVATVKAIA